MNSLVLMENAGRGCVDTLFERGIDGPVIIACGKGNNGGDGLVMARHLELRGAEVTTLLTCSPSELSRDALANFEIVRRSGQALIEIDDVSAAAVGELVGSADWCVDALLGTGATGEPRPPFAGLIELLNSAKQVLSVDVPSGLDCETGRPASTTVRARITCTFVAPKIGFQEPAAQEYLGELRVLDIGAPRRLIEQYVPT